MKTEVGIDVNEEIVSASSEIFQFDTVVKEEFKCDYDGDFLMQTPVTDESEDKKVSECEHCKKLLESHTELVQHLKCHMPLQCASCSELFNTDSGVRPFQSTVCDTKFRQNSHIIQHDNTHGKRHKDLHVTAHNGKRPHKCDLCNKCYKRKYALNKHLRKHPIERPHKCNTCNMCFKQKGNLNAHMRMHTNEWPHKCNTCNKCFRRKDHLKVHLREHTNERPEKCSFCDKCFRRKNHLKDHLRTHTDERPEKCNFCDKCFRRKHHLKNHLRTHTDERPEKCNFCNKCFRQKDHLKRHLRMHTNEQPHE